MTTILNSEASLALITEIDQTLSGMSRWYGVAVSPSAEAHVADRVGVGVVSFQVDAGNNAWGAWKQIIGSEDTPSNGYSKYSIHSIQMTGNERAGAYFIQISFGTTGDTGIAANYYTEQVVAFDGANNENDFDFRTVRVPSGIKAWLRILCPSQNTGTLNFYFGIREYT